MYRAWLSGLLILGIGLVLGSGAVLAGQGPTSQKDGYQRFLIGDPNLKRQTNHEGGLLLSGGGNGFLRRFNGLPKRPVVVMWLYCGLRGQMRPLMSSIGKSKAWPQ